MPTTTDPTRYSRLLPFMNGSSEYQLHVLCAAEQAVTDAQRHLSELYLAQLTARIRSLLPAAAQVHLSVDHQDSTVDMQRILDADGNVLKDGWSRDDVGDYTPLLAIFTDLTEIIHAAPDDVFQPREPVDDESAAYSELFTVNLIVPPSAAKPLTWEEQTINGVLYRIADSNVRQNETTKRAYYTISRRYGKWLLIHANIDSDPAEAEDIIYLGDLSTLEAAQDLAQDYENHNTVAAA